MPGLPTDSDINALREILDRENYNAGSLSEDLGTSKPPTAGNIQQMLEATREASARNAVIRLFLIGDALDRETAAHSLDDGFLQTCIRAGFLRESKGRIAATLVIVPIEGLLFASDAFRMLGTDRASEFVLPASTHSANFLRHLTLRDPVKRMLDLGCGCGIHALFAARHSEQVVATDISTDAIRYTAFNATLNRIDNVECRQGDTFGPVEGESFDLIVSNPPFVMGPDEEFTYRDNNMELDGFCQQLLIEGASHLNDGGYLQMLCEWAETEAEPWRERIANWLKGGGCTALVLHSAALAPAEYVARRAADITLQNEEAAETDAWLSYFRQRQVTAVHPGMITMQRADSRHWLQFQALNTDVTVDASDGIKRNLTACDFLSLCEDDESLLESVLILSPEVKVKTHGDSIVLERDDGLYQAAEVDQSFLDFLRALDGQRTLAECVASFGQRAEDSAGGQKSDLLPAVRLFVSQGFVDPAAAK